jgi:hypothetical protein
MLKKISLLLGIIASFCVIYGFCCKYCLETIDQLKPSIILLLLVVLLLGLTVVILFSCQFNKNIKLKPKFGVLWDKDKEPHCPACQSPLSQAVFGGNVDLNCIKCNQTIWLTDNNKDINLEEARELLTKTQP